VCRPLVINVEETVPQMANDAPFVLDDPMSPTPEE